MFSFAAPSQGLWGWANNTPGSRWRRPWRWWRAVSLPWSQVRALIAPSGSARMRRVRAPAPGRALPAPGEGPLGRGSRWRARPGSPIALAPLLADDRAASSQFPGTARSSIVRAPARSTACPRSGAHNPPAGALLRAQRREGSTIPCSYEAPPPMACGSTCEVASWLIVRPSAAGESAHGAPPPPRAPGLEAPADPAGRAHPGAGPGTGPQNRVGIEVALLGTGAPGARPCAPPPRPCSTRRRPRCA